MGVISGWVGGCGADQVDGKIWRREEGIGYV